MKTIYIIILIFLIILCLINIKLYEVDGRIYFENLYKPNYNLLNKRVAICISGQICNGYDKTLLLQKIFLIDSLNADVFCCFEDTTEEIKQFIKDNLNPKKIIYVNNIPKDPQCNIDYGTMCMYNKIYLANKLKKEYEIDNNFIYDYVIRIRPDLVVKEHLPSYIFNDNLKNNIYMPIILKLYIIIDYPDFMAISSSHNMDIYSDIFNYLSNLKNNKINGSEPLLYMYLNEQNINGIIFNYPINLFSVTFTISKITSLLR
jgi:hypothetical protein